MKRRLRCSVLDLEIKKIKKWLPSKFYANNYVEYTESDHSAHTLDTIGNCQRPVFSLDVS